MDESGSSKLMTVFSAAKKMLLGEWHSPAAEGLNTAVKAADRAAEDRVFGYVSDPEVFVNSRAPNGREACNRGRLAKAPRMVTRSTGSPMQWVDMTGVPVVAAGQQQPPYVPATFSNPVETTTLLGPSPLGGLDLEEEDGLEEDSQALIRTGSPDGFDRGVRSPVHVDGADLSSIKAPSPDLRLSPSQNPEEQSLPPAPGQGGHGVLPLEGAGGVEEGKDAPKQKAGGEGGKGPGPHGPGHEEQKVATARKAHRRLPPS